MIWLNVENVTIPKSVHSAMEQETTVETTHPSPYNVYPSGGSRCIECSGTGKCAYC